MTRKNKISVTVGGKVTSVFYDYRLAFQWVKDIKRRYPQAHITMKSKGVLI